MKIYTKKGDAGETSLYGGSRVRKDAERIRTYGTFDELNAALGIPVAELAARANDRAATELRARLMRIQGELFQLGSELATPPDKKPGTELLGEKETLALENEIDAMEEKLEPLTQFILPGGSTAAAHLHHARTIARRAERELVTLASHEAVRPEVMKYVNRLSDYLFVAARFANHCAGIADVLWVAPGARR